jgi:hypothetical protein
MWVCRVPSATDLHDKSRTTRERRRRKVIGELQPQRDACPGVPNAVLIRSSRPAPWLAHHRPKGGRQRAPDLLKIQLKSTSRCSRDRFTPRGIRQAMGHCRATGLGRVRTRSGVGKPRTYLIGALGPRPERKNTDERDRRARFQMRQRWSVRLRSPAHPWQSGCTEFASIVGAREGTAT